MRKIVRLTESDLHNIVAESVNRILEWHKKTPKNLNVKLSPRQQEIYDFLFDSINEDGIDEEELKERAADLYVAFRDGYDDENSLNGRPLQYYNDIVLPIIEAANGNEKELSDFKAMSIKLMTNCRTGKLGARSAARRAKGDIWCGDKMIKLRQDADQEILSKRINPELG